VPFYVHLCNFGVAETEHARTAVQSGAAQAVSKLQALDSSFTVTPDPKKVPFKFLKSGGKGVKFYINSVPREVNSNLQDVLAAAADMFTGGFSGGFLTLEGLSARPTWTRTRAELALQSMIQDGTCMIDDGDPTGERLFWLPVLAQQAAAL
jgi:EAP30/Vps36 family